LCVTTHLQLPNELAIALDMYEASASDRNFLMILIGIFRKIIDPKLNITPSFLRQEVCVSLNQC
jgi:hypothetical protein